MTRAQQHPCYQCAERTVGNDAGCHATCERYQMWKRAYDEQQAALREARQRGAEVDKVFSMRAARMRKWLGSRARGGGQR